MKLAGVVGKRGGDQLMALASQFDEGPQRAADTLGIRANYHGIRNGWFVWPVNFDPVWLEACNGFTAVESGKAADAVDPVAANQQQPSTRAASSSSDSSSEGGGVRASG